MAIVRQAFEHRAAFLDLDEMKVEQFADRRLRLRAVDDAFEEFEPLNDVSTSVCHDAVFSVAHFATIDPEMSQVLPTNRAIRQLLARLLAKANRGINQMLRRLRAAICGAMAIFCCAPAHAWPVMNFYSYAGEIIAKETKRITTHMSQ